MLNVVKGKDNNIKGEENNNIKEEDIIKIINNTIKL